MTPFATELRRAMAARGITAVALGADIGVSVSAIADWRRGRRLPGMANGHAVAEALSWPALARMVARDRSRTCPVCEATFVVAAKAPAHGAYCSKTCRAAAAYRRLYGKKQDHAQVARHRLTIHQEAVAAFCTACTARTLICQQPACELRPVSPAKLARSLAA